MTKNQLDIIFRTTLNWVACMTHAKRTNEPFNPFFFEEKKYCITFVLIMGVSGIQRHKEIK